MLAGFASTLAARNDMRPTVRDVLTYVETALSEKMDNDLV